MATWNEVRKVALALPDTTQTLSHGQRAWLVRMKFFVWERPLRRSDLKALGPTAPTGPILGIRTAGLEMKEAMLASNPAIYFTTPHFDGYPAVLARLPKLPVSVLRKVILEAWCARASPRMVDELLRAPRARPKSKPRTKPRPAKRAH